MLFCFRQYKVTLVALSADSNFEDSQPSNALLVHSAGATVEASTVHVTDQMASRIREYEGDDDDLPVRVVKVTDTSVHLDWSAFVEEGSVTHYRVVWNSVAHPAVRGKTLSCKTFKTKENIY